MNNEKVLVVPTAHTCLSQNMNSLKKNECLNHCYYFYNHSQTQNIELFNCEVVYSNEHIIYIKIKL